MDKYLRRIRRMTINQLWRLVLKLLKLMIIVCALVIVFHIYLQSSKTEYNIEVLKIRNQEMFHQHFQAVELDKTPNADTRRVLADIEATNRELELDEEAVVNAMQEVTTVEVDIVENDDHIVLQSTAATTIGERGSVGEQKDSITTKGTVIAWNISDISDLDSDETRRRVYDAFYRPVRPNLYTINCSAILLEDNRIEITKAKIIQNTTYKPIPLFRNIKNLDCNNFKRGRGYILHPLSKAELQFPLAFSLIVYRDMEQVERLLRAIYRPHNVYCIHIDSKTPSADKQVLETLVDCFDNVVFTDKSINVTWGTYSVLEAELLCMEKMQTYKKWKYYINLTGQEFPLKTNRELVAILNAMDGANIIDGTYIRAREKYFYRWTKAKLPPPHRIRPIKGSVHVAVNRDFVNFALGDQRARDFLAWLEKTEIPDETFFASLNHNPQLGINGTFTGDPEEYPLKPSLTRYKNWQLGHSTFSRGCDGKFVRHICVLGLGDVHRAYSDIGFFANKFHLDFEPLALDCLEDVLHEKTWSQYLRNEHIDTYYYDHLDYKKKKLFVPP